MGIFFSFMYLQNISLHQYVSQIPIFAAQFINSYFSIASHCFFFPYIFWFQEAWSNTSIIVHTGIINHIFSTGAKLSSHLLCDNVCRIFLKSSKTPLKIPKCPSSDCLKYLYPDIMEDICKKKKEKKKLNVFIISSLWYKESRSINIKFKALFKSNFLTFYVNLDFLWSKGKAYRKKNWKILQKCEI